MIDKIMFAFLVIVYGVLFYVAGKYDFLKLLGLMIEDKTKELEKSLHKEEVDD